jgi:hypothetical protein
MTYTIISDKIGTVGTEFVPGAGTNIEALLAHGFIKTDEIVNDIQAPKSAKTKAHTKKD